MDEDGEIQYRGLEERDLPSLVRMLQAAFGRWPRLDVHADAVEHLRWKVMDHPNAPFPHAVAVLSDEVVGATLRLIESARLGGRWVAYASGSEIAVHPRLQEQRIYRRLREVKWAMGEGRFAVQVGHTGNALIRSQQPKRRWTDVANETRMLAAPAAGSRMPFGRVRTRSAAAEATLRIERLAQFDERTDSLFEAAAPEFGFIVERYQPRMNWRYFDVRGGEYLVLGAFDGDALVGYAVAGMSVGRAFLEDVLAMPGRMDAVIELAQAVRREAAGGGADTVRCAVTAVHPYREALFSAGFRPAAGRTALVYRGRGASPDALAVFDDPAGAIHYPLGEIHLG